VARAKVDFSGQLYVTICGLSRGTETMEDKVAVDSRQRQYVSPKAYIIRDGALTKLGKVSFGAVAQPSIALLSKTSKQSRTPRSFL
jgi:hypothetical protein